MPSLYNNFVKKNINKMPQTSPNDRMKAVAKLWMSQGTQKLTFRMKDGDSLADVLAEYMEENYKQHSAMMTTKNIRFTDNNGRNIFLQLKWFLGDIRFNGEFIIKEISIDPKGGNVLTKAVEELVRHPHVKKWGLNKVVVEAIMDHRLFLKLQERGWEAKPGIYNNLYWNVPGYKEPTLDDLLSMY